MAKPKTTKLHVIQLPNWQYGFASAADMATMLRLMDKAIPVDVDREAKRGVTDAKDPGRIACEMNLAYRPAGELLALPERGTHPALYDQKMA